MKRLTLVRHAQAEPALAGQSDFDRVLTRRGMEDAADMARRLKQRRLHVDHIVTSPAARALATAQIFARTLKLSPDAMQTDERIYAGGIAELLRVLHDCGNHRHLLLAGHNPIITDCADKLSNERRIDAMPTCSLVTMQIDIADWSQLAWGTATAVELDYPGRLS